MSTALLDEVAIDERDGRYLRQAIAWSRVARDRGNRPFGAVVIAEDGRVLAEAYCNTTESGDCTGHAETNLVRLASRQLDRAMLAGSTLYTSTEPCAMCSGAIHWSGIGRVVFALSEAGLYSLTGAHAETQTDRDRR